MNFTQFQLFKARGDRFSVVAEHFSRGLFRGRSGHPMKVKTMRSNAPHLAAEGGDPANVREEKPVKVERLIVPKSSARSNAFSGSTSVTAKSSTGRSQTSATSLPVDHRKSSRSVGVVPLLLKAFVKHLFYLLCKKFLMPYFLHHFF